MSAADGHPAKKDWPQFLGPTRNGIYTGGDLLDALPQSPRIAWKVETGQGWSSPVVADGKVLIFHRMKDEAILDCLDAANGKQVWRSAYPTHYVDGFDFDPGPRATPAVADGRVFTFGAEGVLRAVELSSGKEFWAIDTVKDFKAQNGFFGLASSPIVAGDKVIALVGGATGGKTVVAIDCKSGKLGWSLTLPQFPEAGYSSPTIANFGGHSYLLVLHRAGLAVLDLAAQGRVMSQVPFRSRQEASVNAATPLVVGNEVFLSASYGVGAKLLKFEPAKLAAGDYTPQVVWENDDSMSSHYATCVVKDGFLYGFHGRQEQGPELRCVEWATGKARWSQEDFGAGTVTLAGDKLVVLTEKGVLRFVAASPEAFKELGHAQILPATVRAYPAIANGMLFARGPNQVVCVDLRKEK